MKYGSRAEIVSNILESAREGTTKTKIMYTAVLSYAKLQEYLSVLLANGLLEYKKGEGKFNTTSKGLKFLGVCNQLDLLAPTARGPKDRT